jgi:hypothetical protein
MIGVGKIRIDEYDVIIIVGANNMSSECLTLYLRGVKIEAENHLARSLSRPIANMAGIGAAGDIFRHPSNVIRNSGHVQGHWSLPRKRS